MPNIEFVPQSFPEESDLDRAISESGAVFYCAKLPYGSGIVNKTLYANKPIMWIGNRGRAFEFLQDKFKEGKLEYSDIFVPHKIYKKFQSIKLLKSSEAVSWEDFYREIATVADYL